MEEIKLVIVGSTGLDDIKTPYGEAKSVLGGSGIYSARAAAFFTRPGLVSIAGKDLTREALKILHKADLSGLKFSGKTFRWQGLYEKEMNEAKTIKTEINSLGDFKPELPENYRSAKLLFLANTDPIHQLDVISQVKNPDFVIADTMNYWITSARENLEKLISKTTLMVLNEGEAKQLFATSNLIIAGKELLKLGPKYAVIKKGEHGALLFSRESFFSAPSYPLDRVVDPTGAGDTFAGALSGYLAKTGDYSEKNIRKGVILGSVVASFCAQDFSLGYAKKIKYKDIKERYNALKKIRQF